MEDTEETKLSGGRRTQSNYYSKSKIESDPKKVLVMSSIILEFEKGIEKSTFPSCLPEGIQSRLRRPRQHLNFYRVKNIQLYGIWQIFLPDTRKQSPVGLHSC